MLADRSDDSSASLAADVRLDLAPYSKLPWLNNPEKDKRIPGGGAGRSLMALLQARTQREGGMECTHVLRCCGQRLVQWAWARSGPFKSHS